MEKSRLRFRQFQHSLHTRSGPTKTIDKDNLLFVSLCFLAMFMVLLIVFNTLNLHQQYVSLAASFLEGKLHFLQQPDMVWDTSFYAGNYYWPLGPLPAVLIMPLYLVFRMGVNTGYIGFFLTLLIVWYLYKLALLYGVSRRNARWLAFAFVFSTSFSFVNYYSNWPWYFANVLSVFLIILAMYEWQTRQRLAVVGFLLGLSMTSRPVTSLIILSFAWLVLIKPQSLSNKVRELLALFLPFGIIGILLLLYNYARFDNFLEFGYQYQLLFDEALATRNFGSWSLHHYPMNLFYLLFNGFTGVFEPGTRMMQPPFLRADGWGTSILLTSPILLFLLKNRPANHTVHVYLATSLLMLLLVLGIYNPGATNYGNRHMLDFFPLLFPAFVASLQDQVSRKVKVLIIFSFLLNFYMSLLIFQS